IFAKVLGISEEQLQRSVTGKSIQMPGPHGEDLSHLSPQAVLIKYRKFFGWSKETIAEKLSCPAWVISDIEDEELREDISQLILTIPVLNLLGIPQEHYRTHYWSHLKKQTLEKKRQTQNDEIDLISFTSPEIGEKKQLLERAETAIIGACWHIRLGLVRSLSYPKEEYFVTIERYLKNIRHHIESIILKYEKSSDTNI
ncbi:hypothetical protein ACFL4X_02660, partial [Gemmatimonadota bacterium]